MALPFGSGFSPLVGQPRMGMIPLPNTTATLNTLTTGGGVETATAAEVLGGLLIINCDDAQTLTLPTAALLNAAIPGVNVGTSFRISVINTGDTTLTIAVGTGGTLVVDSGASKSSVATIVANASKDFWIRVTSVATPATVGSTDGYTVYGLGSIGAATA